MSNRTLTPTAGNNLAVNSFDNRTVPLDLLDNGTVIDKGNSKNKFQLISGKKTNFARTLNSINTRKPVSI